MQANSAIIKDQGILAYEVYDNNNFSINHVVENDDLQNTYTVRATSNTASGFQGMLLENANPQNGESRYVFVFRGTEGTHPISNFEQFWKDLIIADIAYMGTGTAPQQMKDAMAFVYDVMHDPNLNLTLNASNTSFTGHSLGGAIAGMASYVYGFDAYTFNGFGIKNMLWDADDTYATHFSGEIQSDEFGSSDIYYSLGEYLEDLGVIPEKEQNRIINIVQDGYSHSDLVGGILTDIISGQVGETHFVLNHTGNAGGGLDNHDIKIFNQSIAIYNNILPLFSDEDYDSLSEILRDVQPDDKKVERLLESLGELG